MSFNWLDFLKVADDLLKYDEECYLRTSISRSYYGAFGTARHLLEDKKVKAFSHQHIHKELINYLMGHPDAMYRKIGFKMNILRKERVKADYICDVTVNKSLAKKVYNWAIELRAMILAQLL